MLKILIAKKMTKKQILAAVVLVVIAIGGYFSPVVEPSFGVTGTRFPNGLSADSTSPVAGEVRGTTLTFTGAGSFGGLLTLNAGQLRSYTNSSTTVETATMKLSDVQGYDTVILAPTGANANKTLTFFASSTASAWLPAAGDLQETCFLNATTGPSIIFAAGIGIDLQIASSSPLGGANDLTIAPNATACFKFIRKASTASTFDIEANLTEFEDGD